MRKGTTIVIAILLVALVVAASVSLGMTTTGP